MFRSLIFAASVALASTASATTTLTVDGTDAVFGAGVGSSTAPEAFTFTPSSGLFITVGDASGTTGCCGQNGPAPAGADGATIISSGGTNIGAANGISGARASVQMFLAGVFIDSSNLPSGTAPAQLDFRASGLGTSFTDLNPLLNQTFWVGDGLTGTGTGVAQKFFAPTGADTLWLGFVDGGNFQGNPAFYFDNPGAITVNVAANTAQVPLPAGAPLLFAGIAAFAAMRRKHR